MSDLNGQYMEWHYQIGWLYGYIYYQLQTERTTP